MSDTKISALPSASALAGSERLPVSQSNQTRGATVDQVATEVVTVATAFTPSGSGAVARTVQAKVRDVVSAFDFMTATQIADVQANTALVDVTSALNSAITACKSNGSALYCPAGTYLCTSTLTSITGQFTLFGDGRQRTTFQFAPTANDVLFDVSNGASQVINVFMHDFGIKSTDTSHVKVALDLYDLTTCTFKEIYIYGTGESTGPAAGVTWHDSTNASIGIRTHGRDSTNLKGLEIVADYPIYIDANPNSAANDGEDMDHWHWEDLYLLSARHYLITMANGIGMSNTTFDGFQAWVGGTGGFFMNDTRGAPIVYSHDINFHGVRHEQCQDANGYSFNISAAFRITSLGFRSVFMSSTSQGIFIDRVLSLSLERVTAATANGKNCLNVTTPDSDSVIDMRACIWQLNSVFTLTNYTAVIIAAFNATDFQGPATAFYVANTNQVGTLWNGAGLTAHVVATLPAVQGSANGGGDRFKLVPNASGNGVAWTVRNDGDTIYAPAVVNSSYLGTLNKIYPSTDGAALQTACGLYAGTGAPNNANGANGDIYFRSDGGALTTVYQRRAGTWTGIV